MANHTCSNQRQCIVCSTPAPTLLDLVIIAGRAEMLAGHVREWVSEGLDADRVVEGADKVTTVTPFGRACELGNEAKVLLDHVNKLITAMQIEQLR